MDYAIKDGHVVTDAMLDEWAEAADNGDYGGTPGHVFSGPVFDVSPADPVSRTFSLSVDMSAMLDSAAKQRGVPVDMVMRHVLIREFASAWTIFCRRVAA
ncbi:hypothetical protein [Bifidobacterium platyrrhinorum]|uniref:Uncharacterized protein n=1 Tax=Bifidobacterium platyrrhinorum TaxID=2661628 RepID=A0A6L9SQI0_9BIFI|nr:hypothetical protein [Bifidobacterium platyrrhinorum]NEG54826.1 hypothetical protein [Bifidobacterium platyrrhinorum]